MLNALDISWLDTSYQNELNGIPNAIATKREALSAWRREQNTRLAIRTAMLERAMQICEATADTLGLDADPASVLDSTCNYTERFYFAGCTFRVKYDFSLYVTDCDDFELFKLAPLTLDGLAAALVDNVFSTEDFGV